MKEKQFVIGGDLPVHRLGFGAMRITGKGIWGEPKDPAQAKRVLKFAVEEGVNFIDTADSYGPEVSERLIAEALHPYPAGLVIASKAGLTRSGPDQWAPNGRPEYLKKACDGSLKRLRIERMNLFQLHRIDPKVPAEDQFGALKDLLASGKVQHVGLSEVSVEQIKHARKFVPVVSVQNRYSISDRGAEDVLNYCEQENIAFIPWFPLAAGELTAPGGPLDQAASKYHATQSQIALAWLLWRSPVMLPIPGTSSEEHLKENIAAASLKLEDGDLQKLGQKHAQS